MSAPSARARMGAVARRVSALLPDSLVARVLPRSLRWDPSNLVIARAPQTAVRLYIAPANSAGQGYQWARAVERLDPAIGAVDLMTVTEASARFSFPTDVAVPAGAFVFAAGWQKHQRHEIETGFSHVLIESGRFAYGSVPGSTPLQVAQELAAKGVRVGLLWHGSDIRLPSAHARREPDSPFRPGEYPTDAQAVLEAGARRNREFVESTTFPVFVSTPGLLDVPRAEWLPVVIAPDRWRSDRPVLVGQRPVVVFAPSSARLKGGDLIERQLEALDRERVIEYRRVQGVRAVDMPAVYGAADIVLDQFRLGDYGVAACEALAAGRLVIGHVADEVRQTVAQRTGRRLPIVQSRMADVRETILTVLADAQSYRSLAVESVDFVRETHDGRAAAAALAPFLMPGTALGG